MPLAVAEEVVTDIDIPTPSGGSGYPVVPPVFGTATVDIDRSNMPAAPASSAPETPGPATPAASVTFTGVTEEPNLDGSLHKPPDTHVAVGTGTGASGRVVQVTNTGVGIWDKTGSVVAAADDLDAFIVALGGSVTNGGFDPKIIFDQHSSRFFIVILDGKNISGSVVHICTSKSATPGTISSTDWSIESDSAITSFTGPADSWFDYPGIGADLTRLVITGNMFNNAGTFLGQKIRVFLKSSLTDDGTPSGATFNDIDTDNSVTSGIGTVQPAHVYGSTINGDFYLINRGTSAFYRIWQVTGAGGSATLAGGAPTAVGWTAGATVGSGAPQTNDGFNDEPTISTLSGRLMNAVYRNDGGNTDSIWLCQTSDIVSGDSGASEVAWFEIDPNTTNSAVTGTQTSSSINDSGSINGPTAGDWTYMPSISVNGSGDVCMTFSQSSSSTAVSMRVTTRHASDSAGTFQTPVVIATGAGEYDDFSTTNPERWGDYSATVVDPADDETFWVSNEICQTAVTGAGDDGRWGTRIAKMGNVVAVPVELSSFGVK